MQIHNEREKGNAETIVTLWRFDMEKGENGTESIVCDYDAHTPSSDKYKAMYAS